MKMQNHIFLTLLAGTLVCQGNSSAFAQGTWVGESVLPTKPSKDIKFGDVVQGKQIYFPLSGILSIKVRDDREGWLRIHDGQREGWAEKTDFVLVGEAPAYFTRRVQANPKDTYALYMRGVGWLNKGDPDNAIKDFDACILLNPTDAPHFNSRGIAWYDKKDYDKAIRDYDEAIRIDPKFALAFNSRGSAWYGKKEYDKAIRDLDEAIRLDPKDPGPFYDRACCHALLGRTDPAIESLRQSLVLGWRDFDHMAKDSDLESIRNDPRYKEMVKKYVK